MKRIFYSCFLLVTLLISRHINGQSFAFTVNPQIQCFSSLTPVYTATAAQTASNPGSVTYSYSIVSPSVTCPASFSYMTPPSGTAIVMAFSCCGVYTVNHFAFAPGNIPNGTVIQTVQIVCPTAGTISASQNTICTGSSATLTGSGAASYTWFAQSGTAPPVNIGTGITIPVSPTAQTTYSFIGTTPQNCTVVSAPVTIYVQRANLTYGPASATLCPGAPLNLTSNSSVTNGGNWTTGTAITSRNWLNPSGTSVGTNANVSTPAVAGIYSIVVTHTGAAGTCSLIGSVNVSTISTINVNLSASQPSVCPNAAVTLIASLPPPSSTVGAAYSWTASSGTPTSFVGNPVVRTPNVATTYTVAVNYYGCTGTNTVQVGMSTLTTNLIASSSSVCPSSNFTLTASGGLSYTFTGNYANSTSGTVGTGTNAAITTSALTAQLPATFVVNAFGGGCTGTSSVVVNLMTLNTQLVPNSPSVCPNTTMFLGVNHGCNTTFTVSSITYSTSGTGTTCTSSSLVAFPTGSANFFPLTFTVNADSAGCIGSNNIVIFKRDLVPNITPSSYSICPYTSLTLTAFGGAGNNYTFTAPYPVTGTSSVLYTGPNSSLVVNTPSPPPLTFTVEADSANCVGSSSITIFLHTITPTITASSASVCPGNSFTLSSTGGAGTNYTLFASHIISGSTNSLTSSASSISITSPSNTTTFPPPWTYTIFPDSAGCVGTGTVQVGLLSLSPNLSLSASSNSVCPGTTFTLTATNGTNVSNASYSFFAFPTTPITTTIAVNKVTTSFPTTTNIASYYVAADSAGCVGTATLAVFEKFLTNLTLSASPGTVCAGMPVTLTAGGVGAGSAVTYTIASLSPSAIVSAGPSNTAVVNPASVTVYAMIADSAGCKTPSIAAASVTVNIQPGLVLVPAATSASVCGGMSTTLTVNSLSNNVSYTWTPANATNFGTLTVGPGQATSAVAQPTTAVTYTINGLDTQGCIGSTVITIGIDPVATLSVTVTAPINTICPGLNTTLTASCNVSPVTYTWGPSNGLSTVNGSTTVASPTVLSVYTATADNGFGCRGTGSYTVYALQYPSVTAVPNFPNVCAGYNSTITAFGANSYTWTGSSFTTPVVQTSISVGPGTYTVVGSLGGGCTNTISAQVGTLAPLTVSILASAGTQTTCIVNNFPKFSKPITLTATGANNYVWFPYNPAVMTLSLGASTVVRPPATTIYTVNGSTSSCAGSRTIQITVVPQFTINVTPPLPAMCLGDSLKLSIIANTSSLAIGPISAFTYSWADPPSAPPISLSNNLTQTVMAYPQNTSIYTVETRDSRGCVSQERLVTVTVLPRPVTSIAIPTINNVPTNTVCFVGLDPGAEDVILNLIGTNKNTNLPFGVVPTYTWMSPYNKPYNSILTPANNNAVFIGAPVKLPSIVVYTLQSGYNGVPGCARFDTVSVRVVDCRPVRTVSFVTQESLDTICKRGCITFINLTDTMAGGTQTLTWEFKGGNPAISNSSIQTVCYNLPGEYPVILTVKNPYPKNPTSGVPGSSVTRGINKFVKVVDVPNVTIFSPGQLRSDTTIRFGTSIELNGTGASTFSWSPNYNITSLTDPKVTVTPFKNTQYILTGKNSRDCFSSDTLNVIVIKDCGEMFIPNAFTPNNDGVNDVLYVRGICLETLTFMIFNRWGEKVFETSDQRIGWDGNYKGEPMNTGVFVFRLEGRTYSGEPFSAKGNITLIR